MVKSGAVATLAVNEAVALAGGEEASVALELGRQDQLFGQLNELSLSIRALACERRMTEQPHRKASCRLMTPLDEDDLLTADGRQAACRACLT